MKTASRKDKGRVLQKLVGERLSKLTGFAFGPDEMIASREMGQSGVDIRLVADAKDAIPWSIECKNCERWSVNEWIAQAKKNQELNTDWLLVMKKNRSPPVVCLDAEVFFAILDRLPGNRKGR